MVLILSGRKKFNGIHVIPVVRIDAQKSKEVLDVRCALAKNTAQAVVKATHTHEENELKPCAILEKDWPWLCDGCF